MQDLRSHILVHRISFLQSSNMIGKFPRSVRKWNLKIEKYYLIRLKFLFGGEMCVSGQEKQQQNIRESALTGCKIHIFVWQAG